jgi:peptidoglycan/xylan/chitin deacetylase (PgdA/CDA1 family)
MRLARLRPVRAVAAAAAITALWAAPASADTIVSLTFDDGWANQMAGKPILAEHDMNATYYLITDRVGNPDYFTWGDVASLHADGNEIAGHTTNHQSLTLIPPNEARAAVCDSRQALLARGYPQVSFAFPRGHNDAATEALVEECGYLSGRDVTPIGTWEALGERETIPPANRWALRTPGSIDANDELAEIQDWIMDAELVDETEDDVWIPLVFHHICDPVATPTVCSDPEGVDGQYITPSDLDALLDWLENREPSGTRVETVAQVIDPDTQSPTSQISCDAASCSDLVYYHPVSVTLSASDPGSSGLKGVRYTTDGSDPTTSSPLYTGPITVNSTTTIKFRAEDHVGNIEAPVKSQRISIDTSPPIFLAVARSLANGSAEIVAAVNRPGTLDAVDASVGGAAVAAKKRKAKIKPTSHLVTQAGEVRLVIEPSKAGKRILRRKGKLKVTVLVTYRPVEASPISQTFKVKLRLKRR